LRATRWRFCRWGRKTLHTFDVDNGHAGRFFAKYFNYH